MCGFVLKWDITLRGTVHRVATASERGARGPHGGPRVATRGGITEATTPLATRTWGPRVHGHWRGLCEAAVSTQVLAEFTLPLQAAVRSSCDFNSVSVDLR